MTEVLREPTKPEKTALSWRKKLQSASYYITLEKEILQRNEYFYRLAGYISVVGEPQDQDAQAVFQALCNLFFKKDRIELWNEALDLLPTDRVSLINLGKLVQGYEKLALQGHAQSLSSANINLTTVIPFINEVSSHYELFLEVVQESWRTYASAIFSPLMKNKLENRFRGAFGELAREDYSSGKDIEVIE